MLHWICLLKFYVRICLFPFLWKYLLLISLSFRRFVFNSEIFIDVCTWSLRSFYRIITCKYLQKILPLNIIDLLIFSVQTCSHMHIFYLVESFFVKINLWGVLWLFLLIFYSNNIPKLSFITCNVYSVKLSSVSNFLFQFPL